MITSIRLIFCILWSVLMISSSLIIMLLTLNRKIPVIMARTCWAPGILWACGVSLTTNGCEYLQANGSYVFVCNHLSYLDIPVLFRAIPVNLYFVAKKEIKWVPFIGWYMAATGMIFIDRGNKSKAFESLKRAGELIKRGKSVLMFPEGTRSKDGRVGAFKKGPFVLAAGAEIAVVPLGISGSDRVWKPGGFRIKPGRVDVRMGLPIERTNSDEMGDFVEEVRQKVIELRV